MAFYVYVLLSLRDRKTYTGQAENLLLRFDDHRRGHVKSARNRRPLVMLYFETYPTRQDALDRERYFKTPEGGVVKRRLIEKYLQWACSSVG